MLTYKEKNFLKEVWPSILKLNSQWFPADKKSPDGNFYACSFCDMNCGEHKNHDDDCLYERAKITVEKCQLVDIDLSLQLDYKKRLRSKKELENLKNSLKISIILKEMYKYLEHFKALDYKDKNNSGIICSACAFNKKMEHYKDCPFVCLGRALSKLIRLQK